MPSATRPQLHHRCICPTPSPAASASSQSAAHVRRNRTRPIWMCLYNLQMPRLPVEHLPWVNGPRGRLSIAIRRRALVGVYRSGRCDPIRLMNEESWPVASNASVDVFPPVTGCVGALKCGARNSFIKTITCQECPFTSPCDLGNTAWETAEWRPL